MATNCTIAKPYAALRNLIDRVTRLEGGSVTPNPEQSSGGSGFALNRLDNSFFIKPVNQREVSGTITQTGFFIDRWRLVSGSVTLSSEGITLNGSISQVIEEKGKGNLIPVSSAGVASFDPDNNTFTLTGEGVLIEWAALYEGSSAPAQYTPKGYAVELAACQRFFLRIGCNNRYHHIGLAHAQNTTQMVCSVCTPHTLRENVAPSVAMTGELHMTAKSGTVFCDITSVGLNQRGVGSLSITMTSTGLTQGWVYDVYVPSKSYLDISADL